VRINDHVNVAPPACSVSLAEFDKDATAHAAGTGATPSNTSAAGTAQANSVASTGASTSGSAAFAVQRRVVLLRNVFSEADAAASGSASFYTELEEDMSTECGKCGPVLAVRALLRADAASGTRASEFVEGTLRLVFGRPTDAEKCVALMNGRRFDGRCLVARLAVDVPSDPPALAANVAAGSQLRVADGVAGRAQAPPTEPPAAEDALLSSFLSEMSAIAPDD